jgi:D-alanyl-D-alanine carboxypeptidase
MKRWAPALCALTLLLPFRLDAQPSGSPERIFTAAMARQIDALGEAAVRDKRSPGVAIGVVEDGRVVYARGFGYANLAKRIRTAPNTQFYVADLTMQFTAAAALVLEQDGKIKLDDKVTKYLPELTVAGNATVLQLLQQTAGLPDYAQASGIATDPSKPMNLMALFSAVDKLKPQAAPGSAYADSPLNYWAAALIVERASGVPLSDYLQQKIFSPLVMTHTFLAGDNGISPARAVGYKRARNAAGFDPARSVDPTWLGGARGLVSTVYDLAKWDIEMPVLLRVDAVRELLTPAGPASKCSMGLIIDRRGGKPFAWYVGRMPGYRAFNAVLPDEHLAVIALYNADVPYGTGGDAPAGVGARVLDVVDPPQTATLDNTIVARAKEWLQRLADRNIDRAQLTPAFSKYLSDDLIARENFAALGQLKSIVPLSSTMQRNGNVLYEFLVRYPRARYRYKFAVTPDGKIDEIVLVA